MDGAVSNVPRGTIRRQCCWEGCEKPRPATRSYCDEHWAEYHRQYLQERTTKSFLDGVDACVRLLREQIGDKSTTGRQAAQLVSRLGVGDETPEQAQRRQLIERLTKNHE